MGYYFSYGQVKNKDKDDMIRVFERIFAMAEKENTDLKLASFMASVEQMAEALKYRGRY